MPPGRRRCRQPAVAARTAAEKGVSEASPHGNRRNDKSEVEKGGAVVSPPRVERREWQRAHAQMESWRRGCGCDRGRERVLVSKPSAVTAGKGKKERPAVGSSGRVPTVGGVGSGACV